MINDFCTWRILSVWSHEHQIESKSRKFWSFFSNFFRSAVITDQYKVPDAVSSHVATDKSPSKFRSIFSDNLQPIATRGKKARGTLLVDIGCSSKRAPLSVNYYNEISGGHIGSCRYSEEGLCRPSTAPVAVIYSCPGVCSS